ncbi:MarR family winged helix-turn-helix transcriptional regulator [Rhodococcus opacus]|uniref:MarR family winged helix-turn-helix transcriptional regulator n=1 Tax=Rhodococcus opacus TaxID=37919 RepID=UPI00352BE731
MQLLDIHHRLGLEHRTLTRTIDSALRRHGLTHAKFEILDALVSATTAMAIVPLATKLQRHWTTTSSTVERLEAQGLVTRNKNPDNRRQSLVETTARGRAVYSAAQQSLLTLIESP